MTLFRSDVTCAGRSRDPLTSKRCIMMLGYATNPLVQIAGPKRHSFRLTCGLFVRIPKALAFLGADKRFSPTNLFRA